jgi:hypothetical protein
MGSAYNISPSIIYNEEFDKWIYIKELFDDE